MKSITNPPRSTSKIPALQSASAACLQARLLLLRAAIETVDPILKLAFHDMAEEIAYLVDALVELRGRI